MKRLHVHVSVGDLSNAIGFYSTLFAARPSVVKPDYAKWMLDDPRVNFAISMRGRAPGLNRSDLREAFGGPMWRDPTALLVNRVAARRLWRPRLSRRSPRAPAAR